MGKAQTRAKRKYNEANYYRIALTIPIGLKEPLKEFAAANDTTVNRLLNEYVAELLNAGIDNNGASHTRDTNTSINRDISNVYDTNTSMECGITTINDTSNNINSDATGTVDTSTSIFESDTYDDGTSVSIQKQSSCKITKGKPSPQRIESWVRLRGNGVPFRKIAEMPEGGGYGKSAIQRHVSAYCKP